MKYNSGFVSLVLVMSVSTLLLVFTYIQSGETFLFFDQTQRKQYRLMNYYNAYNCIDRAILNLAHDYFYEISTPVEIGELNCSIDFVKKENGITEIRTSGTYKKAVVKRSALVKVNDRSLEVLEIE